MNKELDLPDITLIWSLGLMAIAAITAILISRIFYLELTKPIALGIFVISFVAKIFHNYLRNKKVLTILISAALLNIFCLFFAPADNLYPGALLAPVGVAEISLLYLAIERSLRPR